ncbi:1-phosphatidylinositol 4-kinase [Malassezia psittaci]|uniref:1-phosphatidylinositol 4-kinase n=1 Tax=Malassezia psittaci TaxID=1821823 RepID=A0AAF0F8L1_9BASI|nr:1-phosphatidylinositol 4-kinase [Malassezia psittaci]
MDGYPTEINSVIMADNIGNDANAGQFEQDWQSSNQFDALEATQALLEAAANGKDWQPSLEYLPQNYTPIDLTAEEEEDLDEPILVETRMAPPASSSMQRRNAYQATARHSALPPKWVCIGVVYPSVLCMYGLPPELQLQGPPGEYPEVDPGWESLTFWGEPGYRPVAIHEGSNPAPSGDSGLLTGNQRHGLQVSTLLPGPDDLLPTDPNNKPEVLNEFGTLSDKYSKVFEYFMNQNQVMTISRCKLVSPMKAQAFTQSIETLVFVAESSIAIVSGALTRAGIFLETPEAYNPSDFPDMPKLLAAEDVQPRARPRSRFAPFTYTQSPYATTADTYNSIGALGAPPMSKEMLEEEQKAQINSVYDSLKGSENLAETEPGDLISARLFPHQKQALTFLLDRERARSFDELLHRDANSDAPDHISLWTVVQQANRIHHFQNIVTQTVLTRTPGICRGAILADDMGLGKTITVISVIAKTMQDAVAFGNSPLQSDAWDEDEPQLIGDSRNRRSAEQARREELRCRSRATLLVCPLSIVSNWETQIREHWDPDRQPSIYIYHGSGRLSDPHMLANHDVVITTYSTLGSEFSNQTTWAAAAGRSDKDDDLLELDQDGPTTTKKRRKITEAPNTCQRVEWFRVVLDEAHIVKESRTWQSKAVCNLSAPRRICLTGTPIQNKLDDLYALILFLRLEPFSDRTVWNRFCRDKKHLYLNQSKSKDDELLDPTSLVRVQTIMKFLTLRRMKTDRRPDGSLILSLPPKTSRILKIAFSEEERSKYKRLHSRFREEFEEHVAGGTVGTNYATILHEILILRMMCDSAELVEDSKDSGRARFEMEDLSRAIREDGLTRRRAAEFFSLLSDSMLAQCNICGSDLPPLSSSNDEAMDGAVRKADSRLPIVTRCQHTFCASCFQAQVGLGWPKPSKDAWHACPCCGTDLHLLLDAIALNPADADLAEDTTPPPSKNGSKLLAQLDGKDKGKAVRSQKSMFLPDDPSSWPTTWSSKICAMIMDLVPFAKCNPASQLYDPEAPVLEHFAVSHGSETTPPIVEVRQVDNPDDKNRVPVKSVVFSQWTRMLDKVGAALTHAGIRYRQLDGTLSRTQREEALQTFKSDPGVEVFLVSLRAGGFGLNLVSACRAYLLDPYWNPAVENQGLDRIYRLGQVRPVIMTKYIVQQSIEEQMLELQRRKTELANRVGARRLTGDDAKRQRNEELKLLFS